MSKIDAETIEKKDPLEPTMKPIEIMTYTITIDSTIPVNLESFREAIFPGSRFITKKDKNFK